MLLVAHTLFKHKETYPHNQAGDCAKCSTHHLLFIFVMQVFCHLRQEKWQGEQQVGEARWVRRIVLSWLFLGSIMAKAGTECTKPRRGGEDVSSLLLYTFPPDTKNTPAAYAAQTPQRIRRQRACERTVNDEWRLVSARSLRPVWIKGVEKPQDNRGNNHRAQVQTLHTAERSTCFKFSSKFDGVQSLKRL